MSTQALSQPKPTLNPLVTLDPFATKASCDRWSVIWKATATVAIISTLALSILSLLCGLSLFYSAHVAGFALISVALIKGYVWDRSEPYAKDSAQCEKLIREIQLIEETELPGKLEKLGVKPAIEMSKLEPLYARYCAAKKAQANFANGVWLDCNHERIKVTVQNGKHKGKEIVIKDYQMGNLNWSDPDQLSIAKELKENYYLKIVYMAEAAKENLKAAYLLKLMQSPYEKRSLEDFVQINPLDSLDQILQKAMGDPSWDSFAKTKGKGKSYTTEELLTKDTTELAREVFELPVNA